MLTPAVMQLEGNYPIRSRKEFLGDTNSCGSYIYPEDWAGISYAHITVASLLSNVVRDVLWDLHKQLIL